MKKFLLIMIALIAVVGLSNYAFALQPLQSPPDAGGTLGSIVTVEQGATYKAVHLIIIDYFLSFLKYIVGAIAVAFITYSGVKMITEEDAAKSAGYIKNIIYATVGLIIVILADEVVNIFVMGDVNTAASAVNQTIGQAEGTGIALLIDKVLTFVKYIVGAISVVYIVYAAVQMIIEKDSTNGAKYWQNIIYVVGGMVVIILADELVNIFLVGTYTSGTVTDTVTTDQGTKISTDIIKAVLDVVRYMIGALAILFLVFKSIVLVTNPKEEERTKAIQAIVNSIIAFTIVIVSEEFVKIFYSTTAYGGASYTNVNQVSTSGFNLQIIYIINGIERMIAVLGIATIVFLGGRMVVTGSEEDRKKAITGIGVAVIGLILVILSSSIVAGFYGKVSSKGEATIGPDMQMAVSELIGIVNYALGFLGIVAVMMMVYGGYLYVTAGGNEENKKKATSIIINFFIGMIIIISAYTIVRTIIGG